MTHTTAQARRAAVAVLISAIAASVFATASFGHYSTSHRTNYYTWHTSTNIPSGWEQALINGVLVWDNVPNQCHDFLRVATGSGQIPHWRNSIDGQGGTYAITTDAHNNIKYDIDETWHTNVNTSPGQSSLDLWSLAAHENGHTLALNHSSDVFETMYPWYGYGATYWRSLETGDRNRIQNMYPPGSC
jgi:hypothetical protein